ncbi:hypothetical protein [Paenibacillus algicola]|uniref:hypothetical protein n=1 Tax=Paenibacillus algicola TaxID=2565926 RepID=UPI0010FF47F9|nr:hypothetical protein [Paenibacillus algicola]
MIVPKCGEPSYAKEDICNSLTMDSDDIFCVKAVLIISYTFNTLNSSESSPQQDAKDFYIILITAIAFYLLFVAPRSTEEEGGNPVGRHENL